jgi:hypothetical protein
MYITLAIAIKAPFVKKKGVIYLMYITLSIAIKAPFVKKKKGAHLHTHVLK